MRRPDFFMLPLRTKSSSLTLGSNNSINEAESLYNEYTKKPCQSIARGSIPSGRGKFIGDRRGAPNLLKSRSHNLGYRNLGSSFACATPNFEKRHNPASVREWNNSVYAYNSKRTILFSAIDKIVIKLIKSYFNA
jgi:hypothetical protein